MQHAEDFIYQLEDPQKEIMLYLHELLSNEFDLQDKIRYKIPFYFGRSWICYLNPIKNNAVELAFVRGNELSNMQGLLSDKGRKQVYGVEFESLDDIPLDILHDVLQEAILLDETTPYESKNKKRGSK